MNLKLCGRGWDAMRRRMPMWITSLMVLAVAAGAAAAADLSGLDAYIEQARVDWDIPGMAVAVVKDGDVAFCEGFGSRTLGDDAPVDCDTVFMIGSVTKPVTATAIGRLVDAGVVRWDDCVVDHLPGFEMSDQWISRHITIRDLLAHRTGVAPYSADGLWSGFGANSRAAIVGKVRHIEPGSRFRSEYAYSNVMYILAGYLAGKAAGSDWDTLVAEQVFEPLGMSRSDTRTDFIKTADNAASSHYRDFDGTITVFEHPDLQLLGPAGAVVASARDMSRFAIALLDDAGGDDVFLAPGTIREMHRRQVSMPPGPPNTVFGLDDDPQAAYGLGWVICSYGGHKIAWHNGSTTTQSGQLTLVPDLDLGIIILTNHPMTHLREVLPWRIVDIYLDRPERDWSALGLEHQKQVDAAMAAAIDRLKQGRQVDTEPSAELCEYVGTYSSELYGDIGITFEDGMLSGAAGDFAFDLEHWHHDIFRLESDPIVEEYTFVEFHISPMGVVDECVIEPMGQFTRSQ